MLLEPKRKVEMPFWVLSLIIAAMALGWLTASFLFGQVKCGEFSKEVSKYAGDIFRAIFIGSSVGVFVNFYWKHILGETPKAILERSGIDEVYTSEGRRSPRQSAESDFLRLVTNRRTKRIDIIGASLRDFLIPIGNLRPVWAAIIEQLESQKNSNIAEKDRLQVRLLLLDPRSSEGLFRHNVEKSTIGPVGLLSDVQRGLEAIYGD